MPCHLPSMATSLSGKFMTCRIKHCAGTLTVNNSMEIGSAYALQVCLLQIPAMVAFSALNQPEKMGDDTDTFT